MKYEFINVSNFKNGMSIPLFRIYDPVKKEVFYRAYVYGKDNRGKITAIETFEHKHVSRVKKWRESKGHD